MLVARLSIDFISTSATAFSAIGGIPVTQVQSTAAEQAAEVLPDETEPRLVQFTLNINTGILSLSFSEVVNTSSFNVTEITIQSNQNGVDALSVSLTDGEISPTSPSSSVDVTISADDLEDLKTMLTLGVNETSTYIAVSEDLVTDMVGLPLVEIPENDSLRAASHIADMTPPRLANFSIDLNTGLLTLTFDEPVLASTFIPTSITLQNRETAPTSSLILSGGTINGTNGRVLTITMIPGDTNSLNSNAELAQSIENTFLSLTAGAVRDTALVPSAAIPTSNALQVAQFFIDGSRPTLISFDLDMDTGILVLRFDEPVTPSSLVSSRITLQSERSSTPEASYQLPSGIPSTTASESTTLSVSLTSEAINILKATSNLAKSVNDTFLSVETGAVRDVYLNDLESVSPAFALQVSSYTQDMTDPMLNSFTLDLDTSQLILNLTEPVNSDTFNFSQFTFTNDAAVLPVTYQLTGGIAEANGTQLIIMLSDEDSVFLKTADSIATSPADTFLVITPYGFEDTAGNMFAGIAPDSPVAVAGVVLDTSPPKLLAFEYLAPADRPGIILVLTFSEVVNISTLAPEAFTLQESGNGTGEIFNLTDGSTQPNDASVVSLNVTDADFEVLQSFVNLGKSVNNTYLSVEADAVSDILGNPLVGIPMTNALQATNHTVDLVSPEILEFILDHDTGTLILAFNEEVNLNVNRSQFTIQGCSNCTVPSYTLTETDWFNLVQKSYFDPEDQTHTIATCIANINCYYACLSYNKAQLEAQMSAAMNCGLAINTSNTFISITSSLNTINVTGSSCVSWSSINSNISGETRSTEFVACKALVIGIPTKGLPRMSDTASASTERYVLLTDFPRLTKD